MKESLVIRNESLGQLIGGKAEIDDNGFVHERLLYLLKDGTFVGVEHRRAYRPVIRRDDLKFLANYLAATDFIAGPDDGDWHFRIEGAEMKRDYQLKEEADFEEKMDNYYQEREREMELEKKGIELMS